MTKSALDYVDCIGEKKKAMLLKKFGSVKKVKEASIDELIMCKGISEDLAKKIKAELQD